MTPKLLRSACIALPHLVRSLQKMSMIRRRFLLRPDGEGLKANDAQEIQSSRIRH